MSFKRKTLESVRVMNVPLFAFIPVETQDILLKEVCRLHIHTSA